MSLTNGFPNKKPLVRASKITNLFSFDKTVSYLTKNKVESLKIRVNDR